jgi:hypothetical protein
MTWQAHLPLPGFDRRGHCFVLPDYVSHVEHRLSVEALSLATLFLLFVRPAFALSGISLDP